MDAGMVDEDGEDVVVGGVGVVGVVEERSD